ncbi:MAG: hypothetical protein E7557_02085 [Ruminococcaceae bacterium]|nr:hypothetical protein [Oscillospiraceae bacterium]
MKRNILKVLSLVIALSMIFGLMQISVSAAGTTYKITNPYESVAHLLGNDANHYKTNLHTHSTYSDATIPLTEMVKEHYSQDYDILGISDHGVVGREWDEQPTLIPLYQYNLLIGNKQEHFTTEEYEAIAAGRYYDGTTRTAQRGMECLTGAIEGNMLVIQKNHVNGYFMNDYRTEGVLGDEGDFNTMIKMIEDAGGVSHINHPGDWLGSADGELVYDEDGNVMYTPDGDELTVGYQIATDPGNVQFFANSLRKYKSCLGIEVYNAFDRPTRSDRILWDELLKVIIPEGRNVWGFANNDAHTYEDVDTCFMDFILPEYSDANVRTAMENGTFFAVSRYEWGDRIGTTKEYPTVTSISVDDENDTITITGKNTNSIKWIADGVTIQTDTISANGTCESTIKLQDYSGDISCYVRAELNGAGGRTLTQAFVCDDGDMESLVNREDKINFAPVDFVTVFRKMLKAVYNVFLDIVAKIS